MKRNQFAFGLGTIGRDMVYTMISMYLMFYMTDVLELTTSTLWWVTGIILATRVFDAVNDPFMGIIVDNTKSRFGKFKPWIAFGAVSSGVLTVLMFTDFHISETAFIIIFAITYLVWEICYTTNDIAYWSMLPSLSINQREREKMGSIARICANIGLFFVVAGIVPLTTSLGNQLGSLQKGYFTFAILIVTIMIIGQSITLFGVKEPKIIVEKNEHTKLKELVTTIFKNDQLVIIAISMVFFMLGYMTTTSFGLYFFKYAYGDEGMYSIFALILGVSQITALLLFPMASKYFSRGKLYTFATILVVVGYIIFFFAPTNTMLFIGIAGVLIFIGEAFIQLLMLLFLTDTVDYGHWKFGRRNDSITFSMQPFIYKMGGAIASAIVGSVIIISGIKDANSAADVTPSGLLMMKTAMLVFPLVCIVIGYLVYKKFFKLDKTMYDKIISDLEERGDIVNAD